MSEGVKGSSLSEGKGSNSVEEAWKEGESGGRKG